MLLLNYLLKEILLKKLENKNFGKKINFKYNKINYNFEIISPDKKINLFKKLNFIIIISKKGKFHLIDKKEIKFEINLINLYFQNKIYYYFFIKDIFLREGLNYGCNFLGYLKNQIHSEYMFRIEKKIKSYDLLNLIRISESVKKKLIITNKKQFFIFSRKYSKLYKN